MAENVHEIKPEFSNKKPSILKVITHPAEQFQRMKENPKVLIPLLLVTIVYAIWAAMLAFTTDFQTLMGDISAEDAVFFEGAETVLRMTTFISSLFVPVIGALIGALIMWIVVKLTAGDATYKQLLSLNVFVMLIGGLGLVCNILLATLFNLNPIQMITGLTVFFDPNDPIYSIVSLFEVFTIWSILLTVMGLRIVASMKNVTAWIVTIVIFVGGALIGFLSTGL